MFRYAGYALRSMNTGGQRSSDAIRSRSESRELASVANALRMLELLAGARDAGVSEMARQLGISKASVDRLLMTLRSAGFVEQDPRTRRYRLSFKIATLGEAVRSRAGIVDLARPRLRALSELVREGVNLGVFADGVLVYVDLIPSTHIFRIEARAGTTLPAYCTAAGKALLAFMAREGLDAYLADLVAIQHTPSTLTTAAALLAELEEIRRSGYAVDHGELLEEAWCVAAPVFGRDELAAAAVSITAPRSHFQVKSAELIAAVSAAARDISDMAMLAGTFEPQQASIAPAPEH